ncbi:MAG: SufD family Fe-S cluster assembly protein [Akkermansia sp.]
MPGHRPEIPGNRDGNARFRKTVGIDYGSPAQRSGHHGGPGNLLPLEIFHFISGDNVAVFPATLVIAETGSRLHILERHVSADHSDQFCGALQRHHLSSASSVKYALVQELNSRSRAVELCHIVADDSAEMEHLVSHPGAAWARQETVCLLNGDSANVRLLSASHLKENKELDQRTYQKHLYRGASSNLLYVNVLDDEASGISAA